MAGATENIQIKIYDNGCGIPKENMKHVFDPFFTTKHYGTGLGLAIAHSIIDSHNGNIEIESQVNIGTVATITLPVK
jgi:signal transduction histidine kinase